MEKPEEKVKTGLYLPLSLYIELKQEAAGARLSTSDYVTRILRKRKTVSESNDDDYDTRQ